jgi:acyl-coenzyme A thioesterase PaaI-like protein
MKLAIFAIISSLVTSFNVNWKSYSKNSKNVLLKSSPLITQDFSEKLIRLDEELFTKFPDFIDRNAFHDALRGERKISSFEIYRKQDEKEIYCFLRIGDRLNGHPGIVHGGIISLVIDASFGWLFMAMDIPKSVTANLNVNFRKPLIENTNIVIKAKITNIQVN